MSRGRWTLKVTTCVKYSIDSHPFRSISIGPSIPEIQHFHNLTMKILDQCQMTMMLHNYRSRQFHRTSNGVNPSTGFRDIGSVKSGKDCGPWASPYGANGPKKYDVAQLKV